MQPELSREEIKRYSRHLIMPEVGMEGQKKLKAAAVLAVGTGGLGSPLTTYLAAAGVGRLGLVDFDHVDVTNLQRQILFTTDDVGKPKVEVAKARLQALNPYVQIDIHDTTLTSANALEILKGYDIVADGTDNFPTRYLVNDACVTLGKPNVYASIFRFEGQVSVFDAARGPCYRCLYPEPPPPGLVPSCAEGGVLGILPGVIGVMQATEVVKLIIGQGQPLIGRLLYVDALKGQFRELKIRKHPDCPLCGPQRTITRLMDYQEFCGIRPHAATAGEPEGEWSITVQELQARLKRSESVQVIDVREPHEYQICHIPGAKLMPLSELLSRIGELDSAEDIVLHCHHGQRSQQALNFLRQAGFRKLKHLVGGIDAWAEAVDPDMPRY